MAGTPEQQRLQRRFSLWGLGLFLVPSALWGLLLYLYPAASQETSDLSHRLEWGGEVFFYPWWFAPLQKFFLPVLLLAALLCMVIGKRLRRQDFTWK